MALSQRQYDVLAEMGIPVWERRHTPEQTETHVSQPTIDKAPKLEGNEEIVLRGRCVVVVPELPLTDSEHKLLTAMLRTISLPVEQIDLLDEKTFQQLGSEGLVNKAVWPVGTEQQGSLHCDSLKILLAEPQRKASAWQALKQLANQLK